MTTFVSSARERHDRARRAVLAALALALIVAGVASAAAAPDTDRSARALARLLAMDPREPAAAGERATFVAPAADPVASPGISAAPDVIVGEGDGHVDLTVSLS